MNKTRQAIDDRITRLLDQLYSIYTREEPGGDLELARLFAYLERDAVGNWYSWAGDPGRGVGLVTGRGWLEQIEHVYDEHKRRGRIR